MSAEGPFFDREGNPVTFEGWMEARGLEREDGQVARDTLEDGTLVSTVYVGLDLDQQDPPLIYETMAFGPGEGSDRDVLVCRRWATEEEAQEGHAEVVAELSHGVQR